MALTGRAVLLALAGVVAVVLVPGWTSLLGWLGVLVVAVVVDLALAASPRALALEREPMAAVRQDEPTVASVVVTNPGRRRLRAVVRDAWQPSAGAQVARQRLDVPAGERRRVSTPLVPTRRGDRLSPGLAVRSLGPLGVAARQRSLDLPGRLRVLPPFRSRRHLPSRLARLRELEGRSAVQVRGQGTEFDSLREYVVGDDVRSIDWRATARRSAVVVRTWRPERDRHVQLVLDAGRSSAARIGDEPRLDAAMDAALLLAALASRAGDRVDLAVHDRRVRARVEGSSRTDLLPRLVEVMAPVEPALVEPDWSGVAAQVLTRLSRRSLVVLLTSLDATSVNSGLLPALGQLSRKHLVLVASVDDPALTAMARRRGDVTAVHDAAAAERARLDAATVSAWVGRLGVEVVRGDADDLPPALADRYLALKAAGRL
ncbi:DUF58 domain-containing protein [Aquipuribacter nitratireducens]|uniref:DUF58 domain-containing protein n=1 Tax=Aquipuribacter nitratireducens TaxID=650104 RepID=A0ABW0GKY8_9MICO